MTEDLKLCEGQITSINHDKRGVAIKDKAGNTHPFYWSENMKMTNNKGEPLKQWWFIKVVAERKQDDTWWITSHDFFKRPDDWPTSGGRKPEYQPRNDRAIAGLTLVKAFTDLRIETINPDDYDFGKACEDVVSMVEKYIDRVMKAGEQK